MPVQCKDCGLLMFRDQITGQARSADEAARNNGKYSTNMTGHAIGRWLCRVHAPAMQNMPEATGQGHAIELVAKDIECADFVVVNPAKSAEEHEEMQLLDRVKADNAAAQAAMKAMQDKAESRADRAEVRADKAEQRQDKADVRQQRTLLLSGAALFVSVIMGFAGPVGVEYIKRQIGWTQPEVKPGAIQSDPIPNEPADAPGS